jgi:hypothetical protein
MHGIPLPELPAIRHHCVSFHRAVASCRVDRVVLTGQTLAIRSTTQTDPSATAAFACPRILAVAGGGWFGMTVPRALLTEGKRRELEWVDCDRC